MDADFSQQIDRCSAVPFHVQLRQLLEREIEAAGYPLETVCPLSPP